MNAIKITKAQCRRQLTGLMRKIESGALDKVSIYEKGNRVAVLMSLRLMENPLLNSIDEQSSRLELETLIENETLKATQEDLEWINMPPTGKELL